MSEGVYLRDTFSTDSCNEMVTRDKQAVGYLKHEKFPTQISSFKQWLNKFAIDLQGTSYKSKKIALDLGCGPGPYTKYLQNLGYEVIAIDFSKDSLIINSAECKNSKNEVVFLQEDLNKISLMKDSVDLVVMADFLQHLGSKYHRERLLNEAVMALKKDGNFYLSFFNLNIKNYFKNDVHGDFSGGTIRYERLTASNVLLGLCDDVKINFVMPMNIVHDAFIDRILTRIPGAKYLARMMVIAGTKA